MPTHFTLEMLEQRALRCGSHADAASVGPSVADHIPLSDFMHLPLAERRKIDRHFVEDDRPESQQLTFDKPGLNIAAASPAISLPDLTPVQGDDWYEPYVDALSMPGRVLLRFATAFGNVGKGPLVLTSSSSAANSDGTQTVNQQLYSYDSGSNAFVYRSARVAGRFVYHEGHSHFHLAGYAAYRLRQDVSGQPGAVVARADGADAASDKVGFCLLNTASKFTIPGTSKSSATLTGYSATGQPAVSCGLQQGLHVGRADVYADDFDGQWIDITGIRAGTYFLEVQLDAQNAIQEGNESNNTILVPVTVRGASVDNGAPRIAADRFEQNGSLANNNTISNATDLGVMSTKRISGLTLHSTGEADWFNFIPASSGTYGVQLLAGQGNVDLFLYDSGGKALARSTAPVDGSVAQPAVERISALFVSGETYYVKAQGFGTGFQSLSSDYTLRFAISPAVRIRTLDGSAIESTSKSGLLRLERNGSLSSPLTVRLAFSGTATSGIDYQPISRTVTFDVGSSRNVIAITPFLDLLRERSETVSVRVVALDGYVVLSGRDVATVWIADKPVA